MKSKNLLERHSEEIKHRMLVVRILPDRASCLRLVRALCADKHEARLQDHRCFNRDLLEEQKKAAMQIAA